MIDHVSVAVRDLGKAEPFYAALLAPLGMRKLRE
jgi:catechol 2,3-dioxygenase-like lactoylglutathione lyase family enzyme